MRRLLAASLRLRLAGNWLASKLLGLTLDRHPVNLLLTRLLSILRELSLRTGSRLAGDSVHWLLAAGRTCSLLLLYQTLVRVLCGQSRPLTWSLPLHGSELLSRWAYAGGILHLLLSLPGIRWLVLPRSHSWPRARLSLCLCLKLLHAILLLELLILLAAKRLRLALLGQRGCLLWFSRLRTSPVSEDTG